MSGRAVVTWPAGTVNASGAAAHGTHLQCLAPVRHQWGSVCQTVSGLKAGLRGGISRRGQVTARCLSFPILLSTEGHSAAWTEVALSAVSGGRTQGLGAGSRCEGLCSVARCTPSCLVRSCLRTEALSARLGFYTGVHTACPC